MLKDRLRDDTADEEVGLNHVQQFKGGAPQQVHPCCGRSRPSASLPAVVYTWLQPTLVS